MGKLARGCVATSLSEERQLFERSAVGVAEDNSILLGLKRRPRPVGNDANVMWTKAEGAVALAALEGDNKVVVFVMVYRLVDNVAVWADPENRSVQP